MRLKNRRLLWFAIIMLFLLAWFPDYQYNDNSLSRALPIVCYCESGHLYFDRYEKLTGDKSYINGHVYSDKAPLPMLVVLPVTKIFQKAGLFKGDSKAHIEFTLALGGFIVSTFPLLILLSLLFFYLEQKSDSWKNYWLASLPFMGSFVWIYNAVFYGHVLAGTLAVIAYLLLEQRKWLIAGLIGGLAFLTEYTVIILPMCWVLQALFRERKLKPILFFGLGNLPAVIILLLYNYTTSGHFFSLGYNYVNPTYEVMKTNYGFGWPKLEAIWGLSFSLYRGLFVYAPILILVVYSAYRRFQKQKSLRAVLLHPWAVPFALYFLIISGYFMWHGGWSYGPRHLIPPLLFTLFYEIKNGHIARHLMPFLLISALGVLMTLLVKMTSTYDIPSRYQNPFHYIFDTIKIRNFYNDQSFLTRWFGISTLSSGIIWLSFYISSGFYLSLQATRLYITKTKQAI